MDFYAVSEVRNHVTGCKISIKWLIPKWPDSKAFERIGLGFSSTRPMDRPGVVKSKKTNGMFSAASVEVDSGSEFSFASAASSNSMDGCMVKKLALGDCGGKNAMDSANSRQIGSGFSSADSKIRDEEIKGAGRKFMKNSRRGKMFSDARIYLDGSSALKNIQKNGSGLDDKEERKSRRHNNQMGALDYADGRETIESSAFVRPKDERVVNSRKKSGRMKQIYNDLPKKNHANSTDGLESKTQEEIGDTSSALWSKFEKVDRKLKNKMTNSSIDGAVHKRSKKKLVDSKELQFRIGLDIFSKVGDVMGAIALYDMALKEGIKLEQYHYNVLLYLCSSAALGAILPAKSGTINSRSLRIMDIPNEPSSKHLKDCYKNLPRSLISTKFSVESSKTSGVSSSRENSDPSSSDKNLQHLTGNGDDCRATEKMVCTFHEVDANSSECRTDIRLNEMGHKSLFLNGFNSGMNDDDCANRRLKSDCNVNKKIPVREDIKRYAFTRGFEIYEKMRSEKIPLSEAALTSVARMAMSMGDGDMAFEMVKQMKAFGISPRLRSYGPAIYAYCTNGDIEKAFEVEQHMLESGVHPEEPELEALLRLCISARRGDKVYYLLHKLRTSVRKVSPSTANLIESWFRSTYASRVGKRKWNSMLVLEAMENGGGGWHGIGWLGQGKWTVARTTVTPNGVCEHCSEKLATIDLDPIETENFAASVATLAAKREQNSSFQKFQKWLKYYGPFEAVVDAANVGLYSHSRFMLSKVNSVVNVIRQKLPSKKWPLVILHNSRLIGPKMNDPPSKMLIEKWQNADAIYATPTGSNDDWYWLYAAVKFKCLIVTNDEMRDHIFQTLGNDFFPKWKERHQVRFSFHDGSPEFDMPPPCSVVIQESAKGQWHVPIASELESDRKVAWLCATRTSSQPEISETPMKTKAAIETTNLQRLEAKVSGTSTSNGVKPWPSNHGKIEKPYSKTGKSISKSTRIIESFNQLPNYSKILSDIETAEKLAGCTIDFQI